LAYFLFYDAYKKLYHRQKIARMIFSNKFYEKESVQVKKVFSNETDSKEKITYFPRISYQVKNNYIYIRIA
ncbi:UNVERIFIED_CONTAM: ATP-binding protein, partial [Bacillus sp. ATCC 13368]